MKRDDYAKTQAELLILGRKIRSLPLTEFIAQIDKTVAIAPMVDPTLYRKAMANLDGIKKLAESLLATANAFDECFLTIIETAAKEQPPKV